MSKAYGTLYDQARAFGLRYHRDSSVCTSGDRPSARQLLLVKTRNDFGPLNVSTKHGARLKSVLPNSILTVRKDHKGHKDRGYLTQRRKDAKVRQRRKNLLNLCAPGRRI
jgi:hypothetical protein